MSAEERDNSEPSELTPSDPSPSMHSNAQPPSAANKGGRFKGKRKSGGKRHSYVKMNREECLDCKCGSWTDIRNCGLYFCSLWRHRVSMTDVQKAVIAGNIDSLPDEKQKREARQMEQAIAKAQAKEIEKVERLCPIYANTAKKAFSANSKVKAKNLYCLQCANFQPSVVKECTIERCVFHPVRPCGGSAKGKAKRKRPLQPQPSSWIRNASSRTLALDAVDRTEKGNP